MTSVFLDTAFAIGARLAREAIWHDGRCNWLGRQFDNVTGSREEAFATLGPNLYDGTAGIALFLAHLHRLTGDPVFAGTARGAIAHALSRAVDVPAPMRAGFHTGLVGIGYAAVETGHCCGEAALVGEGLNMVRGAIDVGGDAMMTDVVSGLAGTVPALLRLGAILGDDSMVDAARRAGETLLARSVRTPRGLSWDTMTEMAAALDQAGLSEAAGAARPAAGRPHLTGYSHGSGGVALALAELAAATGEQRLMAAACDGFAYEDSWFDTALDQWPDLRQPNATGPGAVVAASAWCHGAAGIGLARLRAFALTGDPRFRDDAMKAMRIAGRSIAAKLQNGAANYSLCHGVAGDAELFLLAGAALDLAEARQLVAAVAGHGAATHTEPDVPWRSGAPGAAQVPGLMLGLAGTGYFYLRVADPEGTPSILLVTPPSRNEPVTRAPGPRTAPQPRSRPATRSRPRR